MKKTKLLKTLLLLVTCFCFLPIYVSADTISHVKNIWDSSGTYYTKGHDNERYLNQISKWKDENDKRVFCVEPTKRFDKTSISGYKSTTDYENIKLKYSYWHLAENIGDLEKVFSCWNNNNDNLIATQALAWELVTEERASIDKTKILKDDYTPYMSNGKVYDKTTLYKKIKDKTSVYNAYKAILRCAARFDEYPSFTYVGDLEARKHIQQINGSFTPADDKGNVATWSKTFKHTPTGPKGQDIFDYYQEITWEDRDKIDVVRLKGGQSIKITSKKEILKDNPTKICFKYVKKDDKNHDLNTDDTVAYVKEGYQTLAKGSTDQKTCMYVYTGPKPTYQLRVRKIDKITNQPMAGVQFDIYDKKGKKIGTTTKSDSKGYAYYKETGSKAITKTGEYTLKEVGIVDGYIENKQSIKVTVSDKHRTGTNNYAESSAVFENTQNELKLTKQTIDENGKTVTLTDDYCSVKVCANEGGRENGPLFTMKKDNKFVCVTESKTGEYTYHSLAARCPSGTTNKIRTCGGKFSIKKILTGTYTVTETETACGYTLPSEENLTKTVKVESGKNPEPITFVNGVTGVIFNKVSEDGYPLDGGKYALQKKVNGIYKDILLKNEAGIVYSYVEDLEESTTGATYELETDNGLLQVKNLPTGEYRFVEKQAPDGYDIIKDKDSKATFTISDKGIFGADGKPRMDYYEVRLVNQKTKVEGSYDTAELIVTIITGRKVANYTLIIAGLAVILVLLIILRNKFKK